MLRYVLTTPRIAGLVPHDGLPGAAGEWEAIIDRVTWERLRALLVRPPRGRGPRSYLLTGFLICGTCRRRLYSKSGSQRRMYTCRREEDPAACGSNTVEAGAGRGGRHPRRARRRGGDQRGWRAGGAHRQRHGAPRRRGRRRRGAARRAGATLAERRLSRGEWAAARPIIEERLQASRTALAALGAEHLPTDLVNIDEHGFEARAFDAKRALVWVLR